MDCKNLNIKDIQISNKEEAINAFVSVLNNSANKTMIEITALNAAGGLMVCKCCQKILTDGIELALNTIKNGNAFDKLLENFVRDCGDIDKIRRKLSNYARNVLEKLVMKIHKSAIDEGIYDVKENIVKIRDTNLG